MGKTRCLHFFSAVFHPFLFILAGNDDMHESSDVFEFRPDWTTEAAELDAPERLKNSPKAYNGRNNVSTFSRLFLIRSFSYLQVMIRYMEAWMSLKFGQIRPLVSMVTDRVMMEKTVLPLLWAVFFILSFSYLQVMMTCMRAWRSSKFVQI